MQCLKSRRHYIPFSGIFTFTVKPGEFLCSSKRKQKRAQFYSKTGEKQGKKNETSAIDRFIERQKEAHLPCAVLLFCDTLRMPPGAAKARRLLYHD